MALILSNRSDFNLENFQKVAWHGDTVTIGKDAYDHMTASRDAFMNYIEDDNVVVYGVTSGYGQHAYKRFSREERIDHAQIPPFAAGTSFGSPLPTRVTRGMVFARLTNFVTGYSAISPDLALKVAEMLDGKDIPDVPLHGNGGAGEILPLSHLFSPLAARIALKEKDSLCLINGSPCASALIADGALIAQRRLELALDIFALAWEAFKAPMGHLDPVLEDLWGDDGESAALSALRDRLSGVQEVDRRSYQAPVSFRILPRYLGRAFRATSAATQTAEKSLKAITDNPVYIMPDEEHPKGRALSTGGYHNADAAPVLDEIAASWADLCLLAERQATKMLDGSLSGLPNQLRESDTDQRYLGTMGMAAVGHAERAKQWAQRTFIPGSESGGYGQNDVATNAFPAWEKSIEAGRSLDACLAILAVVSSQALYVTDRKAPKNLEKTLMDIRKVSPPLDVSRVMGNDLGKLSAYFTNMIENSGINLSPNE